jgi:hypothetical protein
VSIDVPIQPTESLQLSCVVMVDVPIQPTGVVWSMDPSCLGVSTLELYGQSTEVVRDGATYLPNCTVFGLKLCGFQPGFPYKLSQFSSDKSSGKRKLSPPVQKNIPDFRAHL